MRVLNGDPTLDGVRPSDYHLSPAERLNEAATRAYNRLTGVWSAFKDTIAKLPNDAIGTTETRERWLLPLFQELGYGRLQPQRSIDIEGKSYPISHQTSEPVAIHLISCKWDLDKRNPIAKSETKLSPHSLMQEFLNRSPDHLWGFLSNGYKLRILRDNVSLTRAAYVEFDLQAMLDNESYSDFFLLYLLCHQSRVEVKTDESGRKLAPETCLLERWYNTSLSEGVRALDELRDSVQFAIESLGAGFLLHPANAELRDKLKTGALPVHEYYTQVLRQVYRLLLIFVAEDRDLLIPADVAPETKDLYLKYYSTYRIRELAQRKRGTRHTDLWQQLKLLFAGLHTGNPALGLPALGSYLFREESTPDLADCQISNSDLLSAIRSLCYTQKNNVFQPINYRNLGPEELGSVYESLLEMSPEVNLEAGYFKLSIVSGSERKTTGSYYTPTSLVNCLLDSALEPVIDKALHSPLTTHHSPEQALLALKICDPACGSGHFLIAAAHRLAKRLASIRAGEEEPAPSIIQHALRDVIGHCIYGVDLNPMAVELCKISLWMEALEPGKPLTFLDHHIQCGNSLLGCSPSLLSKGIPDAAYTPLSGDDRDYCNRFRRQNREERDLEVLDIFSADNRTWATTHSYAPKQLILDQMADSDLESLTQKEMTYTQIRESEDYQHPKFIFDAWCAAFVLSKTPDNGLPYPITQRVMDNLQADPDNIDPALKAEITRLADTYRFFHWNLAFPEVFSPPVLIFSNTLPKQQPRQAGFDCVLGNPPWERVKLQEKEFFSARDADIANAPNAASRKRMIDDLPTSNPLLYQAFLAEKRIAEGSSLLIRESGRYPLCGRGDVNTYTVFAELNRILLSSNGRCGCIVPSGIATDDTTKFFFQDLTDTSSLVSLYDFANTKGIFPAVDSNMKFSLLTIRSQSEANTTDAEFVFSALAVEDLHDPVKRFTLLADDIYKINPNTKNCPVFRSVNDAEINKYIYRRVPVLINENDPEHGNPWGISFMRMFDMSNDSHLFKTKEQLEAQGFELQVNHFVKGEKSYLPLYEAKMIHLFDHRFAHSSESEVGMHIRGKSEYITSEQHSNPFNTPCPRHYVSFDNVFQITECNRYSFKWFLGFRDITGNVANIRTTVCSIIPISGVANSLPLILPNETAQLVDFLAANMSSFVFDYTSRQKVGGVHLNFFILKQLPVILPSTYASITSDFVLLLNLCSLELYFTSWDLQSFALDCGYNGPPFMWDEARRFEIRCELDALYFHLYLGTQADWQTQGTSELLSYLPTPRHAVDYIMETFPIVKRKDEKEYGEYRTKLRILEIYDQMTHCLATNTEYRSTLNPPPGPPYDSEGNFIPVDKWDKNNWPKHIHTCRLGGLNETR